MSLYHELKRRNVFRVAVAYLALAFLLADRFWMSPKTAVQSTLPTEIVNDKLHASAPEHQYPP